MIVDAVCTHPDHFGICIEKRLMQRLKSTCFYRATSSEISWIKIDCEPFPFEIAQPPTLTFGLKPAGTRQIKGWNGFTFNESNTTKCFD